MQHDDKGQLAGTLTWWNQNWGHYKFTEWLVPETGTGEHIHITAIIFPPTIYIDKGKGLGGEEEDWKFTWSLQ